MLAIVYSLAHCQKAKKNAIFVTNLLLQLPFKQVQNLAFCRPPRLAVTNFSYSRSITCMCIKVKFFPQNVRMQVLILVFWVVPTKIAKFKIMSLRYKQLAMPFFIFHINFI